jgi:hypothetical protein
MIDIHVSGKNAKDLMDELRDLLGGCACQHDMHVGMTVAPEAPVAAVPAEETKPAKPSCTLEELRGVLNTVRTKCGPEKVKAMLTQRGVGNLTDLKPEHYNGMLDEAADLLKEEG